MKTNIFKLVILFVVLLATSCVTTKKYNALKAEMDTKLTDCSNDVKRLTAENSQCNIELEKLKLSLASKQEQIDEQKNQITDLKTYRDKQMEQVGNLTVLNQTANANISQSLSQLEKKDKYITLLQNARTKADSINLALAVNLKSVLKDGIEDEDVDIKVDKTVVFINLSDKMLFKSGSYDLTPKANDVLQKIAKIVESRSDIDVMVEGYTDNKPIKNECIADNWDLSVKRSTAVVRKLQTTYGINPNKLIAAGRGEYNTLADNKTEEGRSVNRRTRIIIMPKLDQFYDLLNPSNIPN